MSNQFAKRGLLAAIATAIVLVAATTFGGMLALPSAAALAPAPGDLTPWAYLPIVQVPAPNTWSPAGSMSTARDGHTATLLPSDKVLVAGGSNDVDAYLASAELYDPASNTWSPAASMSAARIEHTATLLPTGKVLVAGGLAYNDGVGGGLASAELYDPASNTWSPAASMGTARYMHTATLLPTGKVLVAGGYNDVGGGGGLDSAELYDPASNTWLPAASMSTVRYMHTATLLPTGKVLVAGGSKDVTFPLDSAELYNPASNTWSPAASMSAACIAPTATLLLTGKLLVAGGQRYGGGLASAELYDPASNTWPPAGSMSTGRYWHAATLLPSGKVLVAGGLAEDYSYLASAELYDPASNTWSPAANMSAARYVHTATLLPSGKVLVVGGANSSSVLASAELYDP